MVLHFAVKDQVERGEGEEGAEEVDAGVDAGVDEEVSDEEEEEGEEEKYHCTPLIIAMSGADCRRHCNPIPIPVITSRCRCRRRRRP